jgi:hypothetical protein
MDRLCGLVIRVPGYRRTRVRFPGLPDFLRSSGSGTGSIRLVRISEELLEWKSSGSGSRKPRLTAVGIRCADNATPSICKKLALTLPTSGGRSVGIVRLPTKATDSFVSYLEFDVLTALIMKSPIFWDITPSSPLKFNRSFGGTYRVHVQGRI